MKFILLIIGSIMSVLFIVMLFKGKKYDYMLEPLDSGVYPLKSIYSVGLALQDLKIFKLKGKIKEKLAVDATLYYSRKYSEYYSIVTWAQVLSFVVLSIGLCFSLAVLLGDNLMVLFAFTGIVIAVVAGYYFFTYMEQQVKQRQAECDLEFPNAISKLALIVNSGMILHDAWKIVAEGKEGVFYDLMKVSCVAMDNGKSDIEAIYEFGQATDSDDIKKFSSALIQSIERGGGDLPQFLTNQSAELWEERRETMLQKGEKAAGKLLVPIAIMFCGVMLIIISVVLQSFNL